MSNTSVSQQNKQQVSQQNKQQITNTVEQEQQETYEINMSVSHTSTASLRGVNTPLFTDREQRIAEIKLDRFLFGKVNEETFEEEGGLVNTIGLPRDFYSMGKGIEFFSNRNRGLKEKAVKSSTTKAKNPYQAVEITYKKPAKGEVNKKELTNLKIDSNFGVSQLEEIQFLLKETLTYLKMYHLEEEKLKANEKEFEKSGMSSFKVRFNSKEHQEFLKTIFPDHEFLVSSVVRNGAPGVWDFTLLRTENKSGSGGGGSKTGYKTKYDNLVEWVRNGGTQEGLEEFLQSQEVLSRPATPAPTDDQLEVPMTTEVAEVVEEPTEETTEVAEVAEEPKKRGRGKGKKKQEPKSKKVKTDPFAEE